MIDSMKRAVNLNAPNPPVTYRRGMVDDSYDVFIIFEAALNDLFRRMGSDVKTSYDDPDELARMWQRRRSLYEHLAREAQEFWVAEKDGRIIGFSRAIVRDGVRELTELFMLPGEQSSGVGKQLLAQAMPDEGEAYRTIIASPDLPALALYMKAGVYPRFPVYYLGRKPEARHFSADFEIRPIEATPENLDALARLDKQILGRRRDAEHSWLLSDRQGYLYRRDGRPVGYGYAGLSNGPFALLDGQDYPTVLAHAEAVAAEAGRDHFGLEIPAANQTALSALLDRGYRIDDFVATFMSDAPIGQFDKYVITSPPFFT